LGRGILAKIPAPENGQPLALGPDATGSTADLNLLQGYEFHSRRILLSQAKRDDLPDARRQLFESPGLGMAAWQRRHASDRVSVFVLLDDHRELPGLPLANGPLHGLSISSCVGRHPEPFACHSEHRQPFGCPSLAETRRVARGERMLNPNDLRIEFLQSKAKNPGIWLRVNSTKILQFAAGQKIKYSDPSLRSG